MKNSMHNIYKKNLAYVIFDNFSLWINKKRILHFYSVFYAKLSSFHINSFTFVDFYKLISATTKNNKIIINGIYQYYY